MVEQRYFLDIEYIHMAKIYGQKYVYMQREHNYMFNRLINFLMVMVKSRNILYKIADQLTKFLFILRTGNK